MLEVSAILRTAQQALARGAPAEALRSLSEYLRDAGLSLATLTAIDRVLAAIAGYPEANTHVPVRRVAVLCGALAPALLTRAIRCALGAEGVAAIVWEGGYNSYRLEILDPRSELYHFKPDLVVLALGYRDALLDQVALSTADEVRAFVAEQVAEFAKLWDLLGQRIGAPVIQHVLDRPAALFAGPAERRLLASPRNFVDYLNAKLCEAAPSHVIWLDLDAVATHVGLTNWHAPRDYLQSKIPFASGSLPLYNTAFRAAFRHVNSRSKKALVLDLDNTLWGGVIGDDGLEGVRFGHGSAEGEAFLAFCQYVAVLRERGVILAVSSKNDPELPRRMFTERQDMPLKLADFAAFRCSWDDKAVNIRAIARDLNIGLDALVFVDDNPAECNLVRSALAEVYVVALPPDPSEFVAHLDSLHLFDMQVVTETDRLRTASYQGIQAAKDLEAVATDLDLFLIGLGMRGNVHRASPAEIERLAQMESRTNQFNLTTRRYRADEIAGLAEDHNVLVLAVTLADKFAQHGIVSSLIARHEKDILRIDSWLMSCRVFSRSLEQFILNRLVEEARYLNVTSIVGEYIPTERNKFVEDLFRRLGFQPAKGESQCWVLDIMALQEPYKTFIQGTADSP